MNVYVRDLSRELLRRGHHVDVYTRAQDPDLPRVSHALGRGGRVIHVPAGPQRPYPKQDVYAHLAEFVAGVCAQAEADGFAYDLIHSHYWLSGWAALDLRARWGAPIVQMFHTLGRLKDAAARTPEEREPPLRIRIEGEVVGRVDRIVAATPVEERQLVELYGADPARIRVIPPGVDLERFHPVPPARPKEALGMGSECRAILFVGRVEPLKGIDVLLRAIALIARRQPDLLRGLCVPIIGGDPSDPASNHEMARLQALREELGIAGVVTFLGARDQDALQDYYAAAEMVVMPSDYESFGMVALEAMACGVPVIASDVGGLAYLVRHGHTGYRVPPRDPVTLAAKIVRLLTDEGLRRRMGQRAACWAEQYAWPLVADQVEALYTDVIGQSTLKRGA
jgi:D-inositol-3-phosphate glycosyltransferase